MKKKNRNNELNRIQRFSIRKYSFGAASVAIATYLMFMGNGAVYADEATVSENAAVQTEEVVTTGEPKKEEALKVVETAEEKSQKELVAAKAKLASYVKEIEGKLSSGKYDSKTEDSLALLCDAIAEVNQAANATTVAEVERAHANLVTTATTKLKSKSTEKKETRAVDTTNGQPTVGKKAENTEPKKGTNAIENTGSHDSRNGKKIEKGEGFRAETTETYSNFNYSMEYSNGKEIYLYNEEDADVDITVSSTAGNITKATVKGGSGQFLLKSKSDQAIAHAKGQNVPKPQEEEVEIDDYGWSYHQTLRETQGPVKIKITGKPNDTFKALKDYTKTENQHAVLGARYLQLEDSTGDKLSGGNNTSSPGYFKLVVKSQTYKYDIKDLTDSTRITVNDIDKVTDEELTTIKSKLKLEYSKKSNDARLVRGATVANPTSLIDTVAVSKDEPSKLVVTYKDGSVDTIEKSKVLNVRPKGIIPFSNSAKKEIYVYKGEETNLEFGVTDDSGKIKDLRIVQASAIISNSGAARGQVKNEYGLTMTSETDMNGIVATEDKPAITRITGKVSDVINGKRNFTGTLMTRYLVAEDLEGAVFSYPDDNKNMDQEGAFKLVVREQTQKYDVQLQGAESNKIAVADVDNLSAEDFEKIKNNIKIKYTTSDDERLKDKDGLLVENASQYIKSVTKEGDKIVVTYKDGSTDKLTLTEVVTLDKQPAIDAVKKAAEDKIAEINKTPNATDEEKAEAIAKVKDDEKTALTAINDAKVTTKDALNQTQNKGITVIKSHNPVVSKKAEAKAAIEAARKAKEDDIKANKNLTDDEKNAAIAKANKAAEDATKAIDTATKNQTVIDAQTAGTNAIAAVNPTAVTKPTAKKAIEDKLAKQLEDIANTPDATDEEKTEAVKKAKDAAEKAKAAVDAATTDAVVKTEKDKAVGEGDTKGTIDQVVPVVEDKPNARKAIEALIEAKKKEIDARTDLTPKAKEVLKAKVDKIAEEAKKLVDAATKEADVNKVKDEAQSAIRTVGDVNRPIDKVLVKNPNALTAEEKAKILEEVKKVNPTAIEVKYNDEGNIEVTTENGDKGSIIPSELTKTEDTLDNGKGGNDIHKPIDKVLVKSPANLTDEEKAKIVAAVEAVNPNAIVTIDKNGLVLVSTPEGITSAIPATDLVRTQEDVAKAGAGNSNIVKPADKVVGEATDPTAQVKVEEKLKQLNPEARSVKFDAKGNATVTLNDGTTATIPAKDLFKAEAEAAKPKAGNDIVKPADKVVVDPVKGVDEAVKKTIEAKVKAVNPDATVVVDNKGNATVTTPEGKTAVIPASDLTKSPAEAAKPKAGNDIVKPADKVVVDPVKGVDEAAKKAIEAKVKAVNPDATVVVDDKGNATVTLPNGKTAVIPAVDLTKSPAEAAKPKAGNDIVKPADKVVVDPTKGVDEAAKKAIEAKVKAVNLDATVVVDDKGNATVTLPNGKTAVIPAADLTKSPEEVAKPNAGNDIVKPASKTKVANSASLTQDEKDVIEAKVKAVNPDAIVVVDDKGNATVTTKDGKIAVIPASDLTKSQDDVTAGTAKDNAVTPAAKTKVANPEKLTDAEKKAIEEKVKVANPGATVVVDDKGNATVVKDGNVSVIPSTDLVKVQDDAKKDNGGNDANTPVAKTVVADKESLTPEEKEAVKKAVEAVNHGSTVVVDNKGNATVTKPDGTVLNIPASDLVIPADKLADEAKNAKVKTPATRTLVGNKENLTDDEKVAVKKAIEAVNPGATVVVDEKGNATVTLPDGSTATISKEQLVKDKEDAKAKNGGDNLEFDFSKVTVADLKNITPEEKAKFQFMMLGAITDIPEFDLSSLKKETDDQGNTIYTSKNGAKIIIDKDGNATIEKDSKKELAISIDKDGNVTIVTKEGKVLAIPRDDAFRERVYYSQADSKTDKSKLESAIHNLDSLIASQADQLDAAKAKEANALLAEAKEVFGNPNATQAEVDAMVKRLEEFKLNQASVATDDQAANNAANASNGETSEDAANVSKRNNQKELPNTGTSTLGTVLPAIAALLSGVGVFATKKKEDE